MSEFIVVDSRPD